MSEEQQVRVISPPNTLRAKVVEGGPGAVSQEVLARAEKVMADMADSYVDWAAADLENLGEVVATLKVSDTADQKDHLKRIFAIAHDMKGQGGSFGFVLITTFGDMLCKYVDKLESATPAQIEVIALHLHAMQVVVSKSMKGDGGPAGAELLKGLDLVAAKRAG